jgi:hypothetical protein
MTIAFFGYVSSPTPTHMQALLVLAVLIASLPALVLLAGVLAGTHTRTPRAFAEGVCGRCGYSLQGLPGTICPECGADTLIVGTRRVLFNVRDTRIPCTLWIALLLTLNSLFKREIEEYILRLGWDVQYAPPWRQWRHPTKLLRLASLGALMIAGVTIIIWFSRRRIARLTRP